MTADTSVLTVLTNAINAGRQITVAELEYAIAAAEHRGRLQAVDALREESFRVLQYSPKESAAYEHARSFLLAKLAEGWKP